MELRKGIPEEHRWMERHCDVVEDTRPEEVVWYWDRPRSEFRYSYLGWPRGVVNVREDASRGQEEEIPIWDTSNGMDVG